MIRNKYTIKLYVKLRYIWYYITHPTMFFKYYAWRLSTKLSDQNSSKMLNLFIKKTIEKEVDNGR